MPMNNEVIKLVTVIGSTDDENGYTVEAGTKEVEVFAEQKSVRYSEYYAALAANTQAQIIFVVDPHDFELSYVDIQDTDGKNRKLKATRIEHEGTLYRIVRAYRTYEGTLELTCAEVE